MTKEQFANINNGDMVRLPWSTNQDQIINSFDIITGQIISHPVDNPGMRYVNYYMDIDYIEPVISKSMLKAKDKILAYFQEFSVDCKTCPFNDECKTSRAATIGGISLCRLISNNI